MIRIFIITMMGLAAGFPPVQPGIDYTHKRLYRELEKEWGMLDPDIRELIIPASMEQPDPLMGKFFSVSDAQYVSQQHYIYTGRVNSCRAGGCSVSLDEEVYGDSEYFDYFILFDGNAAVRQVTVFNYQATHGQEVSAKGWLKQFEGYDGSGYLKVGKEIDAISGATISVYGITQDVVDKTRLLKRILGATPAKKIADS